MPYGYNGKILRVNLTTQNIWVEEKGEDFFRKYLGGGALGAWYILQNVAPGTDAFDPANIIVFTGSVTTGAAIPGFTRHTVTSVSPLTGGVSDSEAGGYWARELKAAGFEAVVVEGKAPRPVYLWINNGEAELKEASHLWGKYTGDVQDIIREEHKDKKIRILSIGPAGENMVRFACIINELKDANGRGGLGAVMGSKNLKAIAVRGNNMPQPWDKEKVKSIAKSFASKFMDYDSNRGQHEMGTARFITPQNETGQLPTYNFKTGYFEYGSEICGTTMKKTLEIGQEGCYACPIRCKRVIEVKTPYRVDPKYGGPEYESVAALGSYTGVRDLVAIAKANELCNKNSLDTISTGAVIAFAMECYEKGILTSEDTGGLELTFGNAEVMVELVEKIARREGIGDLLAEGIKRVAEKLGPEAQQFAVHCKGLEFPAHEPRVKKSFSLGFGTCPIGADHMASEHDTSIAPFTADQIFDRLSPLGLQERLDMDDLGYKKVRFVYYTQLIYSCLNCLDICMFCTAPCRALDYSEVVEAVRAITGWEISLWELMKVGERRLNMMRAFNIASGMTRENDLLPPRMYEPLESGPAKGKKISREMYEEALSLYYEMVGWDQNGCPLKSKLLELELEWVNKSLATTK